MQVHQPVMPTEVLKYLAPKQGGVYLDLTVGAGGHSALIAEKIGKQGKIIGIDQDAEILQYAKEKLQTTETPFQLFHSPFSQAFAVLKQNGIAQVDGILMDLGVSSFQLSKPLRGFSFQIEGPLDMRMNPENPLTAAKILETYSVDHLTKIFFEWGEDSLSRKIAQKIVERRTSRPFRSTLDLASFIAEIHGATKIFQALRIEVNNEMGELKQCLDNIFPYLSSHGTLVIITFHSIEDRIVKNWFKENEDKLEILTSKPILPTYQETRLNPRSRSAKIRATQKK